MADAILMLVIVIGFSGFGCCYLLMRIEDCEEQIKCLTQALDALVHDLEDCKTRLEQIERLLHK